MAVSALIDDLARAAVEWFRTAADPATGMVPDHSGPDAPVSIAGVGFALAVWPVGVERGWLPRGEAVGLTLAALRFFADAPQGPQGDAAGHRGFFYHFLDPRTGRRKWRCELSTIDTALLVAGMLAAWRYYDRADEAEIRVLAERIYRRVDWAWAMDGAGAALSHGWTPEAGFLPHRWRGHSEALILYALALGAPDHPADAASYADCAGSYRWSSAYAEPHLAAGPLFIHQYPHLWFDLAGLRDDAIAAAGIDHVENSRRATLAQSRYAAENPGGFAGYDELCWGFTACLGPDPDLPRRHRGQRLPAYAARGAPDGDDDGTVCPWAAASSLPFAPELVTASVAAMAERHPRALGRHGFTSGFNLDIAGGWWSDRWFAIDLGPLVGLVENVRSRLVWDLMREVPWVATGLRRCGFSGGWLSEERGTRSEERATRSRQQ